MIDRPVSTMYSMLSKRAKKAIQGSGVHTIRELIKLHPDTLLLGKNCGKKTLDEIEEFLQRHFGVGFNPSRRIGKEICAIAPRAEGAAERMAVLNAEFKKWMSVVGGGGK